jgi:hypothetical protein
MVATHVGGDSAQPRQKTSLLWLERPNLPDRRKPGFLNNFVGLVTTTSTPPDDETIELIEYFQAPHAPGIFVPGKHGSAQNLFPVNSVFGIHAAGSVVTIGISEVLLSGGEEILRKIFAGRWPRLTGFNFAAIRG